MKGVQGVDLLNPFSPLRKVKSPEAVNGIKCELSITQGPGRENHRGQRVKENTTHTAAID